MKHLFISLIILLFAFPIFAQQAGGQYRTDFTDIASLHSPWVDSVYNSLSLEERIAQLLVIRTFSNRDRNFYDSISRLIIDYNLGGLCFFQGTATNQLKLTNRWQRMAKTPLLITIDAEWGLGMRLDDGWSFPWQMTLGAMQNEELAYQMGKQIGRNCKRIGVHINFAPVIDINSNPNNPVINYRSFGENPANVASKGAAYIRGMQSEGVMATAKHFPGHGDTDSDSHYTLPLLNHSKKQIDSIDLYPFRHAIENKVGGIMVAHLFIPALDKRENMATSLSEKSVDSILKKELNFKGLAITDALDMNGVTNYHKPGDIELKAFLAGNDILLLPLNIPGAIAKIKQAVQADANLMQQLNTSCRRILASKQWLGLDKTRAGDKDNNTEDNITEDINDPVNELISRKIYEEAITLVKNENDLIPLKNLESLRIASLNIGSTQVDVFQETLELYAPVEHFNVSARPSHAERQQLISQLQDFNLIVTALTDTRQSSASNFGISAEALQLIDTLKSQVSFFVLDIFGNPYSLINFDDYDELDGIMVSYQDEDIAKSISAQIIFGAIGAGGTLPVSASKVFQAGMGINTKPLGRLKYSIPEELGITSHALDTISKLIEYGISEEAYPGAQVLLAKDGVVFYNRSFGSPTYDNKTVVKNTDLYDLASLTKISATTPAVMLLHDQGLLDIDLPLSHYLPYLKKTNKDKMLIREILAHQARLQAWIPFYWKTLIDAQLNFNIYSTLPKAGFEIPVAKNLYISDSYTDSIFDTIVSSELRDKYEYKYSDLGYYLLYDAIEKISKKDMDDFVNTSFYAPLGLSTMSYQPLQKFTTSKIIPSENDTAFRQQLVQGYVHDPGAAMLGGVSGHAGLFSNANDQAKLMQMYLQNGYYGGRQYLRAETLREFTRQQFPLNDNRRALGFDKPYPEYDSLGPVCESASLASFGHSGFTGTYTWVDPENGLLYVFLSNRVCPDASNTKLLKMNLRTDLHQLIYDIFRDKHSEFLFPESL
jgi:beta-glucosidase-like glycosyl hydrolase/CubicO group peptidase (beta-lactamase class C family)